MMLIMMMAAMMMLLLVMIIMMNGHPTHPPWFEHQTVDANMLTPSLPLRLLSLQSGLGVSCLGGSGKHLRHDNSSNVLPTAACSTHATRMHAHKHTHKHHINRTA